MHCPAASCSSRASCSSGAVSVLGLLSKPCLQRPSCTSPPQAPRHAAQPGTRRRGPPLAVAAAAAAQDSDASTSGSARFMLPNGLVDYYEILQVDDDASLKEIKKAYRAASKVCHPDFLGDEGHNICILLNEAYEVLSDPDARAKFDARLEEGLKDAEDDYTGKPLSKWMPSLRPNRAKNTDPNESRAVFVDEFTCIGCKQCVWQAPATFRMESEHGRSRVFAQWVDTEENTQAAIDSCPVSCIHWVDREQLPALEYVMQKKMTTRTNVGVMMAGQGATADVWSATERFLKDRQKLKEAQEEARKRRPYSPAQEAARRAAAESMAKQSVFAGFDHMFNNMINQMNQTVQGVPDKNIKVGRRKRAVRWDQAYPASQQSVSSLDSYDEWAAGTSWSGSSDSEDYEMIPPERALVPIRRDR